MIKKIVIKNFKSIEEIEVACNDKFNVIIGENNIGKTTIFEAIHLWKICYDENMKKDKKQFYSKSKHIAFQDMDFLRVYDDMDLFNTRCKPSNAELLVRLEVEYNQEEFKLGFLVSKVTNIDNAYLQVKYEDPEEFFRFADKLAGQGYNLSNGIVICESRPIANIITKEPYMYKNQILDKISRGKGYEVLRNKITKSAAHTERIEEHIKNVMQKEYKFNEIDKDNKTYIKLTVNNTNILSQGSGFLQVAEIFSSLEYSGAAIYILLIDEPDSHLHIKLQKRLIEELRTIDNSQLFIISHNDRFLNEVQDGELLFIDDKAKQRGMIEALPTGCKNLVLNNLAGEVETVDKLRYVDRVIILEGKSDKNFFEKMIPKYCAYTGRNNPNIYIDRINGIDNMKDKLLTYSLAFDGIVPETAKWIVIRDTDCVPISKREQVKASNLGYLRAPHKDLYFQNGYGIESTFLSEPENFVKLMLKYYELNETEALTVRTMVDNLNDSYAKKVLVSTDAAHEELETHFLRQKEERKEKIYETLRFQDMLREITPLNIQFIMTKPILEMYLGELHSKINHIYSTSKIALKRETIMEHYYNSITSIEDIFECHKELLELLF